MAAKPGRKVRGSQTGRPIMVLLDVLGKRWSLRILWELREGRRTFRDLQLVCGEISPTVLNTRLKNLREMQFVDHDGGGYGLTRRGRELGEHLARLDKWSEKWAAESFPG